MSDCNGNAGVKLEEELKKEKQKILTRITHLPYIHHGDDSPEFSGLHPIQVCHAFNLLESLKSKNRTTEELEKTVSDDDALITTEEAEIQRVDKEIQKLNENAESKRSHLEETEIHINDLHQSIDECKVLVEESKAANCKISTTLLKHAESSKNEKAQVSEKTKQLTQIEEELERNTEILNNETKLKQDWLKKQRKYQDKVEKADLHINELAKKRASLSSSLNLHDVTRKQLEQQIKEYPEKIKKVRENHERLSAILAAEEEKNAKLQSQYDKITRIFGQSRNKLIQYVNRDKVRQQFLLSIDNIANTLGDGNNNVQNIIDTEAINSTVEYFRKLRKPFQEKRKRRGDNNDSLEAVPPKKAKLSEASSSANIPVAVGTSAVSRSSNIPVRVGAAAPSSQRQEPAPRIDRRSEMVPIERPPLQPSNMSVAVFQHGEIRLVPQGQIPFANPAPPPRQYSAYGYQHNTAAAHGFSQGYFMPEQVHARFVGPGYNSPPPMPPVHPPRHPPHHQPHPRRPRYPQHRR